MSRWRDRVFWDPFKRWASRRVDHLPPAALAAIIADAGFVEVQLGERDGTITVRARRR